MDLSRVIESCQDGLMWACLCVLLLIATARVFVRLRRMSKTLCVRLSPAAIGVFAVAAIVATGEAQKRLLRGGALGDRALPGKTADVGECFWGKRLYGAVQRAD